MPTTTSPVSSSSHEKPLPIDIDYAKFLDWLIDRYRVPRNWHTLLKTARTLSRTAYSQTPKSLHHHLPIPSCILLDDHTQHIPYYTAKDILQTLISTPPSPCPSEWPSTIEKDLLGRYKNSLLRAWSDSVTAYEKKYTFLADTAQHLVRITDIDAKVIKNQVSKLSQEVTDLAKREGPAIRSATDARKRFLETCEYHKLKDSQNVDFESQLRTTIAEKVPELLTEVIKLMRSHNFVQAVDYYESFAKGMRNRTVEDSPILDPLLMNLMTDDVEKLTSERKKYEKKLDAIDWNTTIMTEPSNLPSEVVSNETSTGIDWDIEIDNTGITVEEKNEDQINGKDVNLGSIDSTTAQDQINDSTDEKTSGIDWDIEVAEVVSSDDSSLDNGHITLADAITREKCLTILLELEGFLLQRTFELSNDANRNYESGMMRQRIGGLAATIDEETMKHMLQEVRDVITAMNGVKARRILGLQRDDGRIQRVAKEVVQQKHGAARMEANIDLLRKRRNDIIELLKIENRKMENLEAHALSVKRRVELSVSELYDGREVNILGEINNVFG